MFRKTIFWVHLVCGVAAGIVILMMSVTGVLLTYERQMLAAAERAHYTDPAPSATRLSMDGLIAAAKLAAPDFEPSSITLNADPRAPATLSAGRRSSIKLDPYSGELQADAAPRLSAFFSAVTGWHRWFNSSNHRPLARAITGASNLVFLFLIASGLYLWLPRMYRWAAFKARLKCDTQYANAKARDFNWHHVVGFWTAIPLAVVVATATVFSYGWANDLVYRLAGESAPAPGSAGSEGGPERAPTTASRLGLDALLATAMDNSQGWRTITLDLPHPHADSVRFRLDSGNGGQPQHRSELTLNAYTGALETVSTFASQSAGQRARTFIRYLHTGEALGLAGQTIAGLVSLTSVLMVWTGLALAYRRVIAPLLKRRNSAA